MAAHYWILFIVVGAGIVVAIADAIAAYKNVQLTFSAITAKWALRHTISVFIVGFFFGILIGHLFWYQVPTLTP